MPGIVPADGRAGIALGGRGREREREREGGGENESVLTAVELYVSCSSHSACFSPSGLSQEMHLNLRGL